MIDRIIHASLHDQAAVMIYHDDNRVDGHCHDGTTWRDIHPAVIAQQAMVLDAREYAQRWPGLKLPMFAMAA